MILNRYVDTAKKYKKISIDYYILKGTLNYEFDYLGEAQKDFELTTELLKEDNYYNLDEKKYLYVYIYSYLMSIYKIKGDKIWKTFKDLSTRKNFDIKKVRMNLRSNFPISS